MKKAELQLIQKMIQKAVLETVPPAIEVTVNGKIKKVQESLDTHIKQHNADFEEIRPFLQAQAGGKMFGKLFMYVGGLAASWFAIKSVFPNL